MFRPFLMLDIHTDAAYLLYEGAIAVLPLRSTYANGCARLETLSTSAVFPMQLMYMLNVLVD